MSKCPHCGSDNITKADDNYRCLESDCGKSWKVERDEERDLAGLSEDYVSGLSIYNDEHDL